MASSQRDLEAAIAATRFGVGAKAGEIAAASKDPRGYLKPAKEAMRKVCVQRFEEFGTAGHASSIKAIPLSDMAKRYASGELTPKLGVTRQAAE